MEVYLIRGMSNSYLTSDGVLIDAGAKPDAVVRVAKDHGVEVKYLFITHYHVDHVRYARDIVKVTNCKVVVPAGDSDVIQGKAKPRVRGVIPALINRLMPLRPVNVDIRISDNEEIEGYLAIHAPGHTPGSTAYFKDGVLFSGDAVIERGGKPAPPPAMFTLDMDEAIRSMNKLLSLKPRIIYPGHGKPITL